MTSKYRLGMYKGADVCTVFMLSTELKIGISILSAISCHPFFEHWPAEPKEDG